MPDAMVVQVFDAVEQLQNIVNEARYTRKLAPTIQPQSRCNRTWNIIARTSSVLSCPRMENKSPPSASSAAM